jgi:acetyltransferase-like isoleucine patch superfamily enzyme
VGRAPACTRRRGQHRDAELDQPQIHETAIVEDGVRVGARTAIWDHVHVRSPASIGHDCIIGEKTYVAYGVHIGNYVKINARVYICTGITIQDRAFVAAGVIFTNDRNPRAFVDGRPGLAPSEPTDDTLKSVVCTGATIGAGAMIGPGLAIGAYAMVGMGAVVVKSVPSHGLVHGNPARLRGYVCICGAPLVRFNERLWVPEGANALSCARCGSRFTFSEGAAGVRTLMMAG